MSAVETVEPKPVCSRFIALLPRKMQYLKVMKPVVLNYLLRAEMSFCETHKVLTICMQFPDLTILLHLKFPVSGCDSFLDETRAHLGKVHIDIELG